MPQDILGVACAVLEPAQVMAKFLVQTNNSSFVGSIFSCFQNKGVHLLLGFRHNFFNPAWVNSAILNQLLKSDLGDLAADPIKP